MSAVPDQCQSHQCSYHNGFSWLLSHYALPTWPMICWVWPWDMLTPGADVIMADGLLPWPAWEVTNFTIVAPWGNWLFPCCNTRVLTWKHPKLWQVFHRHIYGIYQDERSTIQAGKSANQLIKVKLFRKLSKDLSVEGSHIQRSACLLWLWCKLWQLP